MKLITRNVLAIATFAVATNMALAAPALYIPLGDANQVQMIDANTRQIVDFIDEVDNVHGFAITPDKRLQIAGSCGESLAGPLTIPSKPVGFPEAEHEKLQVLPANISPRNYCTSYVSVNNADTRRDIDLIRESVTRVISH